MKENWYVVYTKPRWEKKVAETFNRMGVKTFCPLNKAIRNWSDRKKIVYTPLFTSYVFVWVTEKQFVQFISISGVNNLVFYLGKPAIIKDYEIEAIISFLNEHENIYVENSRIKLNDRIQIQNGLLAQEIGIVVAAKNKVYKVALPSLGCVLYAEVKDKNAIKISG